jgi:hypothetical protein
VLRCNARVASSTRPSLLSPDEHGGGLVVTTEARHVCSITGSQTFSVKPTLAA